MLPLPQDGIFLWEKLPEETDEEYALFIRYLTSPPALRELHRFADAEGMKRAQLVRIAIRNLWHERAQEYDRATLMMAQAAVASAIVEFVHSAVRAANEVVRKIEEGVRNCDADSPPAIAKLAQSISDIATAVRTVASVTRGEERTVQPVTIQNIVAVLDELSRVLPSGVVIPGSVDFPPLLHLGPEGPGDRGLLAAGPDSPGTSPGTPSGSRAGQAEREAEVENNRSIVPEEDR